MSLIVAICASAAILYLMDDPYFLRAPKDNELIGTFRDHRLLFEQLRSMVMDDQKLLGGSLRFQAQVGLERRQSYDRVLSEIPGRMMLAADRGYVRFIFATGGLAAFGSGWLKGIVYLSDDSPTNGVVLVNNLDHPRSLKIGNVYLRQIEPHWFIIFQIED